MRRSSVRVLVTVCLLAAVAAAGGWAAELVYTGVASGTGDIAGIAAKAGQRFCGFYVAENAGAVARVRIRHGDADDDPIILDLHLAANQSAWDVFAGSCLPAPDGLFVDRVSGTTVLTLYTRQFP